MCALVSALLKAKNSVNAHTQIRSEEVWEYYYSM